MALHRHQSFLHIFQSIFHWARHGNLQWNKEFLVFFSLYLELFHSEGMEVYAFLRTGKGKIVIFSRLRSAGITRQVDEARSGSIVSLDPYV